MRKDDGVDRRQFLKGATVGAVGLSLTGLNVLADEKGKPADTVKTRSLGKTGMKIAVVGFGCGGVTPQHLPLLQAAYENGMTLFDTAWGYQGGQSETAVGQFVKTLKDRASIHIVTKASGWSPPRGSAKDVYKSLKESLTGSLGRLQTEYVDLFYWPHGANRPDATRNEACREALRKLKEEKLIRHVGTSSHSNYVGVCDAAIDDGFYEALMPVLNICTQNADEAGDVARGRRRRGRDVEDTRAMLEKAKQKGVGVIGMKVANPGFLGANTDKLLGAAFPGDSRLSRHQKLYAWTLKQEGVASVIVGIRSALHLRQAIEVGKLAT